MERRSRFVFRHEEGRSEAILDLGNAKRFVLVDRETVGAREITFGYVRWEARTSFHKKHVHRDAEEVMYIVSGRAIGGVGDEEFEISKGDTIWVPKGMVHWAYNPFDEPFEMLFVYTRPTLESAGYDIVEERNKNESHRVRDY